MNGVLRLQANAEHYLTSCSTSNMESLTDIIKHSCLAEPHTPAEQSLRDTDLEPAFERWVLAPFVPLESIKQRWHEYESQCHTQL